MKKIIKKGTQVMFFGENDIFVIEGIYRRLGASEILYVEGYYLESQVYREDKYFSDIWAIVTPLPIKDKNIEWARLISEVAYKK